MRYAFAVTAFLAVLMISGCRSNKAPVVQQKLPENFIQAVDWDFKRNGTLEISALDTMAKQEALSRRRFYDADARLNGANLPDTCRMSNDPRFSAVDNAAACAAVMLDPGAAELAAKERRYESVVKNFSYLDYYRTLENAGVITAREQDDYRVYLFEIEISQGFDPVAAAAGFDFSTLVTADIKSYSSALPEWMKWDRKTPLLWTKLLLMLPQETARTVDLDHRKLAVKVLEISRAVKAEMAFEHLKELKSTPLSPDDAREKARCQLDLRLAAGAMAQVKERTPELSREEDFIRDLYLLMQ